MAVARRQTNVGLSQVRVQRVAPERLPAMHAVELVDRAVQDGLVKRNPDPTIRSVVRVTLTPAGAAKLDALAEAHLEEIAHLAPAMRTLWQTLEQGDGNTPHPAARRAPRATPTR